MRDGAFGYTPILGLAPATEYTFLVYASPIAKYFKRKMAGPGRVLGQKRNRVANGEAIISATTSNGSSQHPLAFAGAITRNRQLTTQVQSLNLSQATNTSENVVEQVNSTNSNRHISRSEEGDSNSQREASEGDTQGSNSSKRTRGLTRGIGLEKINEREKSKMKIEIAHGKGRPICELQSAKLSSEVGIITREFIPIPTKWKKLDDNDITHAFERLEGKFDMDVNDEYVKESVTNILKKLSRTQRHKAHLHFKRFEDVEVARGNPPPKIPLTEENWKSLCDMFSDENYQKRCEKNAENRKKGKWSHNQGSRAFVVSRAKMSKDNGELDRIEFFLKTHYCEEKDTWRSPEAEKAYKDMMELKKEHGPNSEEPLSVDEIVDKVLGKKSGYIKGLGHGPKPVTHGSSSGATQARNAELELKLSNTQEELSHVKQAWENRYNQLVQALIDSGKLPNDFMVGSTPAQASNHQYDMDSSPTHEDMI